MEDRKKRFAAKEDDEEPKEDQGQMEPAEATEGGE
jgi:hypothetical protein